ncbi:LacI family DNA-binding transcriptional regulator [Fimbriimonas ginsengisoli]|uniref:Transcriptional regulator, LacI family n=1 Tax=Fimbriimonas ginsengisoli Gsoil 348 TaxID=661478 RepID=A0A068NXD3_FIMGI|nr:LacI family DNA-binding transcriptional regulator [Fimbriimonas ginsengisoli]AIE88066.1 transcriptional regulator, LacI family [Fimbriimonas ginsengisoli Gsoil 348]
MAATIKDIARQLNISTSTVSYALNDGPRNVPEGLKQRILELAKELDYRPNRLARSLVTRRSNTIGVVPPSTEANVFLSPFVRLTWNALVNEAEALGQDLLLFTGHNRNDPAESGAELLDGRIDGVVFIAPLPDASAIPFLAERNFPFTTVASGSATAGVRFTCDNNGGVRQAMDHLVEMGHRRIAHITGNPASTDAQRRAEAYREYVAQHGLEARADYVQQGLFTVESGYNAGKRLLRLPTRPTAVFVANDEMAYGLCQALREGGLDVPREMSVVGFDDCDMSYTFNPPITTVEQPVAEMASAALRGAVSLAAGAEYIASIDFPTRLIVRGSTFPIQEVALA